MIHRIFLTLALFCHASLLFAHPHEWMNIVIEPEFDDQNNIAALQQTWLFDPLYAHILLEPVLQASDNDAQRQGMAKIEQEVIQKLEQNQYYTFSDTPFSPAQNQTLYVEDGYLYIRFSLPLKQPQSRLNFRIYEPSYYVEMRYDEEKQQRQWANGCTLTIKESDPSPDMIYAAYALDKNEAGPDNLGQYFAQSSQLICPNQP